MKKFLMFTQIYYRLHIGQTSILTNILFFYCSNHIIIKLMANDNIQPEFIAVFSLFITNFMAAFVIRNSLTADHQTYRLYEFSSQSYSLLCMLLAKIFIYTIFLWCIQILYYPITIMLGLSLCNDHLFLLFIWFGLSSYYLTIHYILAECFMINAKSNGFMAFIIVTPLLIPWFILSYAFILYQQIDMLNIILALILIVSPCIIIAQKTLIKQNISPLK